MSKTLKIQNGDIVRLSTNASYTYVQGRDKVSQDVRETLTTGVNPLTGLGAALDGSMGVDSDNPMKDYAFLPPMYEFQRRVTSALRRLITAQTNYGLSHRTRDELISDFSGVQIWPVSTDSRNFRWKVSLNTFDPSKKVVVEGQVKQ